jgi:hypothetical protein
MKIMSEDFEKIVIELKNAVEYFCKKSLFPSVKLLEISFCGNFVFSLLTTKEGTGNVEEEVTVPSSLNEISRDLQLRKMRGGGGRCDVTPPAPLLSTAASGQIFKDDMTVFSPPRIFDFALCF